MGTYRKERVASAVRQIMGAAIVQRLNDPRISPLTTVTRVSVTGDLLVAKVYLTVHGDEAAERRTVAAVRHAAGFLQRVLAREMPMRQCPELRFEIDEATKGTRRTMELLAENRLREPEVYVNDVEEEAIDRSEPGIRHDPEDGNTSARGVGE